MGAAINGGCSLSTVQQLADGDSSVLLTLLAFVVGVAGTMTLENLWLTQRVQSQALWWEQLTRTQHLLLVTVLSLWAVRELVMQWRRRNPSLSVRQRLAAPRYRLSFGALLLGVCSGLLFLLEGAWTYTNYLREQTKGWFFDGISPGGPRGILVLIPTLSIQAAASYIALLAGIAAVLLTMRLVGSVRS